VASLLGSTQASHAREFVALALILDAGATTALGETSALDDDQERRGRLLLLGKGVILMQRLARPFPAELDD
jgi:hypothetical protein